MLTACMVTHIGPLNIEALYATGVGGGGGDGAQHIHVLLALNTLTGPACWVVQHRDRVWWCDQVEELR